MKPKYLVYLLLACLFVFLGFYMSRFFSPKWLEKKKQEEHTVLLERIKRVSKLVSVEGYFSEIYGYKDYYGFDISPFRKKILTRVKAKASVGYDLSQMEVNVDADKKEIQISNIPDVSLISLDHDLDYYDITEGTFNAFTKEDYNRINANAKAYIEKVVLESGIKADAQKQLNETLDILKELAQTAGYELVYRAKVPDTEILQ